MAKTKTNNISEKGKTTALILSLLGVIGFAGIHRFYAGKIGTGLLWLFTAGFFYIGTIVDIVKIANGNFKDKNGAVINK
jgi:TM2 domain-containing membrane protein YozV